jgi:hypothetical protein
VAALFIGIKTDEAGYTAVRDAIEYKVHIPSPMD